MPNMILLLNHDLSELQVEDAKKEYGINKFIYPDMSLKELWMGIKPEGEFVSKQLAPVIKWLNKVSQKNDYILIQGEYGATFYTVDYCFMEGRIPVYATSERKYEEKKLLDGRVERKHIFKHIQFRRYLKWER